MVNDGQLTVQYTAGIRKKLRGQCISAHNSKPPESTKVFVRKVREIELHDVVSSGNIDDEIRDEHPQKWTKQSIVTLEEAPEAYMVVVIAESYY